jgi:hypothetical protein
MVQLTVNIAHNEDEKVIHQETMQYTYPMEGNNWLESFIAYMEGNNAETRDRPEIIK